MAGRLILSLDEPSESEVERLWLEEAERRLKEFRSGKVRGIPADEVFRRAMDDISWTPSSYRKPRRSDDERQLGITR